MNTPFTSLYAHNRARSETFSTRNTEESLTQQGDLEETDINILLKKYAVSGTLPQIVKPPLSGDFTTTNDFRTMLDVVRSAQEQFEEVPAQIRKRFDNDPAQFMDFIHNQDNLEEMRKLGLAAPAPAPPAPPKPMLVQVVADPTPPK